MSKPENDLRVDYVEFPAADLPAVKSFYAETFGWKMTDWGETYSSFDDGRLQGGFTNEPATPGALVVLYAVDLEAVEAKITANGGKIVRETQGFPGGRRFHFEDPHGTRLAVWSDRTPDGTRIEM